jgi:hypothetical protein
LSVAKLSESERKRRAKERKDFMKPKKSATFITFLVLVFIVFILQACSSQPSDGSTGPVDDTPYARWTPSSSPNQSVPNNQNITPPDNSEQYAAEICNAYDTYNDPFYNLRCDAARAAVQGMSPEQYSQYYNQQELGEQQHMNAALSACTNLDQYNDPNYQDECNQAKQQAWEPANPW